MKNIETIKALEKVRNENKDLKATDILTFQISLQGLTDIITALKMSKAFDDVLNEEIQIHKKRLEENYKNS